ncbi:MAG TPA: PA14 domain-containing protein, partial [Acidobacteriaceae bacterium]|nr:PA14 domain-containing protein [Acidobacteriaceae bacterium]
ALFTFWGADGAKGDHYGYTFENLWLDDWYSLLQIEQEQPLLHGFTFHNIWALGQPPLIVSQLQGQVRDVHLNNVKYGQAVATTDAPIPLTIGGGAQPPVYAPGDKRVRAAFAVSPGVLQPGTTATFTAEAATSPLARYRWFFGDGATAIGRRVQHRYPDAKGTDLDGDDNNGAGRFRVMLQVSDSKGNEDWAEQEIAVVNQFHDAGDLAPPGRPTAAGLEYRIYPGTWPELPAFAASTPTIRGIAPTLAEANARGFTRFAVAYDGFLQVPAEGGYTFALMARDGARLIIDGIPVAETGPPFGEVCGSSANAIRFARGTIGLHAGKHVIRLEALESTSRGSPRLLWEGPGISLTDVPAGSLIHSSETTIQPRTASVSSAHP